MMFNNNCVTLIYEHLLYLFNVFFSSFFLTIYGHYKKAYSNLLWYNTSVSLNKELNQVLIHALGEDLIIHPFSDEYTLIHQNC